MARTQPAKSAGAQVAPAGAYERLVVLPLVVLALAYNAVQLVPAAWLPQDPNGVFTGYTSDLFLLLRRKTSVSTQVLREALVPHSGTTAGKVADMWRAKFGDDALDALLWRLSSVEGRKLYLVIGAAPILACAFCTSEQDYVLYALHMLANVYIPHWVLIGLLTEGPRGVLPQAFDWLVRGGRPADNDPTVIVPLASRSAWRMPASACLGAMAIAEVAIMALAPSEIIVHGRWEHWNANAHLMRHVLLALLVAAVYAFPRMEQPAMPVIRALAALGTTGGCITALGEAALRGASGDAQKGRRNVPEEAQKDKRDAPEERVYEKENDPPTN